MVEQFDAHDAAQVAFVAEFGEEGAGGAAACVAGVDGVDQVDREHQGVDHHEERFGYELPGAAGDPAMGVGGQHKECVENVGVDDCRGVETEAACQQAREGELVPGRGVEVPEFEYVNDAAYHIEQVYQQDVGEEVEYGFER